MECLPNCRAESQLDCNVHITSNIPRCRYSPLLHQNSANPFQSHNIQCSVLIVMFDAMRCDAVTSAMRTILGTESCSLVVRIGGRAGQMSRRSSSMSEGLHWVGRRHVGLRESGYPPARIFSGGQPNGGRAVWPVLIESHPSRRGCDVFRSPWAKSRGQRNVRRGSCQSSTSIQ